MLACAFEAFGMFLQELTAGRFSDLCVPFWHESWVGDLDVAAELEVLVERLDENDRRQVRRRMKRGRVH